MELIAVISIALKVFIAVLVVVMIASYVSYRIKKGNSKNPAEQFAEEETLKKIQKASQKSKIRQTKKAVYSPLPAPIPMPVQVNIESPTKPVPPLPSDIYPAVNVQQNIYSQSAAHQSQNSQQKKKPAKSRYNVVTDIKSNFMEQDKKERISIINKEI
jgi:hypothetical protein